ncbi:MAG: hypothetical protein K2X95_04520 [Flavobacteriaceae bacterium]|nr:hypothetical protein [Flavobacteriaceae bacterium]
MGDIITGIFIGLFIFVFVIISKRTKQSDSENIIKNLIGLGSILGLFISILNSETERILGIGVFGLQLLSIVLLSKKEKKTGYFLLCLTLILQIPILNFTNLHYRCQNLFGINIQEFPGKYYDIESGSYVNYFFNDLYNVANPLFPIGINLVSVVLLIYFISRWKISKSKNYF